MRIELIRPATWAAMPLCILILMFVSFSASSGFCQLPPEEGPGGPILVVADTGNPFSFYYAEILRAEGLNAFAVVDRSLLSEELLGSYDVAILGEMPLSSAEVALLTSWVASGGNLIAMRPDGLLASLLGLISESSTLSNAYLLIDTSSSPGRGLTDQTVQFHGTADLYSLSGATSLATLYGDATTPTANPAVTIRSVGSMGGQAAAFTYDLARSVVYSRQGNPAWSGTERDGTPPIRCNDLFYGNASGDPQPDWIDLNKVAIPQADEQQRLLANLILSLNEDRKPLPRFWYFPRGLKAVVVMTADDHGGGGTPGRFDTLLAESPPGCSIDDWECIRSSAYVYPNSSITDSVAAHYDSLGFDFSIHTDTYCENWTPASLEAAYSSELASWTSKYASLPAPVSNRMHCVVWSDWATQPAVELAHGIRIDNTYYYWPASWMATRPGMFTGSGIPMRFADASGHMIDVYQSPTQMTDESGQSYPFTVNALLDEALGPEGYYGAFCANMHADGGYSEGAAAIVASAKARGVPIISAKQMLVWLDGRGSSSFGSIAWTEGKLSFMISAHASARNLEAMIPTVSVERELVSLTRAGVPVSYRVETIKGVEYAIFSAQSGDYEATYEIDSTPPVITDVAAMPRSDGTSAEIAWTTDEEASSRVDYDLDPETLDSREESSELVLSHGIVLSGLTENTVYYYRVTSTDVFGNTSVWPPFPEDPASFLTPAQGCFTDRTAADFGAGARDAGTAISETGDGEVILKPTVGAEFSGSVLPPRWFSSPWGPEGSAVVSGGTLIVDYALAGTNAYYGPGGSLEFACTFLPTQKQHVGWGTDFNSVPWAIFSTGSSGTSLQARTHNGSVAYDTPLPGDWFGAQHRYRIEWGVSDVKYYIDDSLVVTHALSISSNMRPLVSDDVPIGTLLVVDWMRISPYELSGVFTSRVYDATAVARWRECFWSSIAPAGTGIVVSVRTGDTPVPAETWTEFQPLSAPGADIGASSRFIQYRAELTTEDDSKTPALLDVSISCEPSQDTIPPAISGVRAVLVEDGASATVAWATDEYADSRVTYGFSPAALIYTVSESSLVTAHGLVVGGLEPNTVVYYRVTSADSLGNSATWPPIEEAPASFTSATPACFIDQTAEQFKAGSTGAGSYVSETADGEVMLAPAVGAEFDGSELPGGWFLLPWGSGGAAIVEGGTVTVDGAMIGTNAYFSAGRSIEFVATFYAAERQHIGWGTDFNSAPWAIFSTGFAGTSLQARTHNGSASYDTPLSGDWFGAPHTYRVDWEPTHVDFYIDDSLVVTHTITISGEMRPLLSDGPIGGSTLPMDWLRMTPYASAGTFTSRVFDAGVVKSWQHAYWTADAPAGTAVAVSARTGATPVPDGTWTVWTLIAESGDLIGGESRYVQYRLDLSTTDSELSPVISNVAFHCYDIATGVETPEAPAAYALFQNAPNPFNPVTSIRYDVPAGGGVVHLAIYDVSGRLVATLVNRREQPGRHEAVWHGLDSGGRRAASGIYFCRLKAPGYRRTVKLVMLR
jgi:hypothetical protein